MGALLRLVAFYLQMYVAMAAPGSWKPRGLSLCCFPLSCVLPVVGLAMSVLFRSDLCPSRQATLWLILLNDAGISSMHTAVLHTGTVIFLDRTNVGPSHIKLANGVCRNSPSELVSQNDCYAHSTEFTPGSNLVRPLSIQTDTWCSSGAFAADGTLVQTGGDFDGANKIRYFKPCVPGGKCDWIEDPNITLQTRRWYASNQILPDGSILVVGGQSAFSYEFIPPRPMGQITLPFLQETRKVFGDDQNLYPFLHLMPSGNVFIFARRDSILLDPNSGNIVHRYPTLQGEPRNYPTQGSSVMLPLDNVNNFNKATIMVCGGANDNAYSNPAMQYTASATCGLLEATATNPQWTMLDMPFPRVMGDMILLPHGLVLLINGAQQGSAGWGLASTPVLNPVIYTPQKHSFEVQTPSNIPRMYHSTAVLLPSGQILVAGSNSHQFYTSMEPFPTELRVEAFLPPYLDINVDVERPSIKAVPTQIAYGSAFSVTVVMSAMATRAFQLRLSNAPWATHSFSQGQRQLVLAIGLVTITGVNEYTISSTAPPHTSVAPAGYYMLFPVHNDVPGHASWVQIIRN